MSCRIGQDGNAGALTALVILMQIRTIAIIAEGIPEALTRKLIKTADKKGVTIIGPATVSTDDLSLSLVCLS